MWRLFLIAGVALGTAAAADRAALSGTWQLDPAHSQTGPEKLKAETLSIAQKDDSIQIGEDLTDADGRKRKIEIACNTLGKECKVNDEQVTLYYNGAHLVIIEMRKGNEIVVKRRLQPSEDGKTLTMEVLHIVPAGATESYTFTRQPVPSGASR